MQPQNQQPSQLLPPNPLSPLHSRRSRSVCPTTTSETLALPPVHPRRPRSPPLLVLRMICLGFHHHPHRLLHPRLKSLLQHPSICSLLSICPHLLLHSRNQHQLHRQPQAMLSLGFLLMTPGARTMRGQLLILLQRRKKHHHLNHHRSQLLRMTQDGVPPLPPMEA